MARRGILNLLPLSPGSTPGAWPCASPRA